MRKALLTGNGLEVGSQWWNMNRIIHLNLQWCTKAKTQIQSPATWNTGTGWTTYVILIYIPSRMRMPWVTRTGPSSWALPCIVAPLSLSSRTTWSISLIWHLQTVVIRPPTACSTWPLWRHLCPSDRPPQISSVLIRIWYTAPISRCLQSGPRLVRPLD